MPAAHPAAVLQGFARSLAPGLLVREPAPQDFRDANACLRGWISSLRTADALHLAIASAQTLLTCPLHGYVRTCGAGRSSRKERRRLSGTVLP